MAAPVQRVAAWLADRSAVPTAGRAVAGYYADSGVFDVESLRLKSTVDDRTEAMVADVFEVVEAAIAEEFDVPDVTFDYDTKLILPAQLTLGQIYRAARERASPGHDPVALSLWADRVEGAPADAVGPNRYRRPLDPEGWGDAPLSAQELVDRGEYLTRLVIEALIDGDMRDAVNDAEYEDFEVSLDLTDEQRGRVAAVAQEALEADLVATFERVPDEVEEFYDWAVGISEAHQDRDDHFRELYAAAREGDEDAAAAIREEYRDAPFEVETDVFADEELTLPYLTTQYARVGVIYDGMVEMYRHAGLPVDTAFKRSIVLSIVGAQIWLDDVDDFEADVEDGQLTPVTAEYVLAEDEQAAYERVVSITGEYLDRAKACAAESESPLTGIATEYIYRSGEPGVLPGSDA